MPIEPVAGPSSDLPQRCSTSTKPAKEWEFGLVSGNGRMGAVVYGDPAHETIIACHCRLYLPLGSREIVPDLAGNIPDLRKIIREKGYEAALLFFFGKAREQGFPGDIWTDTFHPGFFLKIDMPCNGTVRDYIRSEDFSTGEVSVRWRDDSGPWRRRLFVSRTDNVIVLSINGAPGGAVSCAIYPKQIDEARIQSERSFDNGSVTYHNIYRNGKGGYDAAVRILSQGGTVEYDKTEIRVAGADDLLLLMQIVPWKTPLPKAESEAFAYSPEHPDFSDQHIGAYTPAPPLASSSVVAYRNAKQSQALLPQVNHYMAQLSGDYQTLFEPHARTHNELFNRVTLDLNGGADRERTTEDLLEIAAAENCLPPALLEKIYDAGRYMFICSAGELPPNLQGIWTGTWEPAWSGDFTTDTNLQLALRHGLSGNLADLMEGYFRLIEDAIADFRLNARRYYGCRGVLAPTRMSNNGLMLHWGRWNGIWWTAGAGWLVHFFYDYFLHTGDREFLARRVIPLLKEVALFYVDFLMSGEKDSACEFIPSFSPESSDGITATMDVMVAKEAITSLIGSCELLNIEAENFPTWRAMLAMMPAYRINADGALAEWVPDGYGEWYAHRHLSHLHSAYEANGELSPHRTPELWKAAQQATHLRIDSDGEQSTHGRMHMGLAAAYLRMAEEAYDRLRLMATMKSMYPSLICSHEPDQRIFNTDGNGAMPEIVNRMLVGALSGELNLLPALPKDMSRGSISGILVREQIAIDRLEWNQSLAKLRLELTSGKEQTVMMCVPAAAKIDIVRAEGAGVKRSANGLNCRAISLHQGKRAVLEIAWTGWSR